MDDPGRWCSRPGPRPPFPPSTCLRPGRHRRLILGRKVARFTELAAEAILTKVPANAPAHARAGAINLDALETLKELGEPRVAEALAAFAKTLGDHGDPAVATRARRLALDAEIDAVLAGNDPAAGVAAAGTLRRLSLAGKVVLVDFWATWCGPRVAEIPYVLALHEKYHDRGFTVVGVSLDEDLDALEAFVAERELLWPILVDARPPNGGTSLLAARYGISGRPR